MRGSKTSNAGKHRHLSPLQFETGNATMVFATSRSVLSVCRSISVQVTQGLSAGVKESIDRGIGWRNVSDEPICPRIPSNPTDLGIFRLFSADFEDTATI
jgi:hypothetical protein